MNLTTEYYLSQLDEIHRVFKKTMKRIFTNPCSCEETELHSFLIVISNNSKSIYYDQEKISDDIFQSEQSADNIEFMKSYVLKKTDRQNIILKKGKVIINDRSGDKCEYKFFWTFSSECLDSDYGTLTLQCFFHQLAEAFNDYVEKIEQRVDLKNGKSADKIFFSEQEIILKAEKRIEKYLEGFFAPFNIDIVNNLSGEYYEKSECKSNMVFLPYPVADKVKPEDLLYHFEKISFQSMNNRLLRKLLQITQDDLHLVLGADCKGKEIDVLGICNAETLNKKIQVVDGMTVPCLIVKIKKHMQWELFLNDRYILTAQNGHYRINRSLQEKYLQKRLTNHFGPQTEDYKDLIESIKKSADQTHGTMLVIMYPDTAQREAVRLGNNYNGFTEKIPRVQTEDINHLNSIDGSIIMDTNGKVYGIGMILDGHCLKPGDPARGARYNSALKYENRPVVPSSESETCKKVMTLVFSEDGSVDIITFEDDIKK